MMIVVVVTIVVAVVVTVVMVSVVVVVVIMFRAVVGAVGVLVGTVGACIVIGRVTNRSRVATTEENTTCEQRGGFKEVVQ